MKKLLALVLFMLPLFAIIYAVYRSTAVTVTTVENGRQVVYGEPQDGLTLGLFVFASVCILSAVLLLIDDWKKPAREQPPITPASNRTATNYPV